MKNKIIYPIFLLTTISCSSFRPYVLTNAYLNPTSTTSVTYENLNFTYALFNQYASGLDYSFRLDYSTIVSPPFSPLLTQSIQIGSLGFYNGWHTITSTFAEGDVTSAEKTEINNILFDRFFNRTTKLADDTMQLVFIKPTFADTVNFSIKIKSKITYSVNVGSIFMAFRSFANVAVENFYNYIYFYDSNNNLLQTYLLTEDRGFVFRNYKYNLSTILTNVKSFELQFQWLDTPPFATGGSSFRIYEFNLFTDNQEINIPDDVSGDTFGFEFVAVEWWNFLGHLQNFAWWIVNKSPIAPVFEWIDDYVVTWISGLITFVTGVFNL